MTKYALIGIFSIFALLGGVLTVGADWNNITLADPHSFQKWLPDRSMGWDPVNQQYVLVYGGDRLYLATGAGNQWDVEIIDNTIGRGRSNSMYIEPDGTIHISYYDAMEKDLWYAVNNGTGWKAELAQDHCDAGYYNSIAVDTSGNVYIAFYKSCLSGVNFLYMMEKSGGTWTEYMADGVEGCGFYPSIAIASDGYPSVSYYCELSGGDSALKYSHFNGTLLTPQTVDTDGGVEPSLTFSDSGTPHIAYYKNADPYHAWWNGISWDTESVDDSVYIVGLRNQLQFIDGVLTLLTLDSSGYRVMLYRKDPVWASEDLTSGTGNGMEFAGAWNDDFELNMALKDGYFHGSEMFVVYQDSGKGWEKQKIDEYDEAGNARALSVNSEGWPQISYAKNDLYYIGWDESQWVRQSVSASASNYIYFSGIDMLPDDMPTVLFTSNSDELIRAWMTDSGWQAETIIPPSGAAYATKIRVDSNGKLHALYIDNSNGLYYSVYDEVNGWTHQFLSAGFSVSMIFDLEVDSASNAHIVFHNVNDNLMTYRMIDPGGGWSSINFAASGIIGDSCNIALDNDENPIILFTEASGDGLWLKYDDGSKAWHENLLTTGIKQYALMGLDVDQSDGIHLSYFDYDNNELYYGYLEGPDDTTMETVLLETFVNNLPGNSSLVLDPEDNPMVLYDYPNYGRLYLAFDMPEPQILAISPNKGKSGAQILDATISGYDLFVVTETYLTAGGQEIDGKSLVNSVKSKITCDFDLAGATPGVWDLVVVAANGTATLEDGFTVESGGSEDDDSSNDDDSTDDHNGSSGDDDDEEDCCGCEE